MICRKCGQPFTPAHGNETHCPKCRLCPICGKPLHNVADECCSRACFEKWRAEHPIKQHCARCGAEFEALNRYARLCPACKTHVCSVCGKKFESPTASRKYCSRSCSMTMAQRKEVHQHICKKCGQAFESKNLNDSLCPKCGTKTCPICGASFTSGMGAKTCSNACAKKLIQINGGCRRHCVSCGAEFRTPNMNVNRCPECRVKSLAVCPVCGKKFEDPTGNKLFCSKHCKKAYDPAIHKELAPNRACWHCGALFTALNRHERFCSRACREAHKDRECRACGAHFKPKNPGDFFCSDSCRQKGALCPQCCGSFQPRDRAQIFCSPSCQKKFLSARRKFCPMCGLEFIPNHNQKYCSAACKLAHDKLVN